MAVQFAQDDLDLIEDALEGNTTFQLVSGSRGLSIELDRREFKQLLERGIPDETVEILAQRISDWGPKPRHTIWRAPKWNPFETKVS